MHLSDFLFFLFFRDAFKYEESAATPTKETIISDDTQEEVSLDALNDSFNAESKRLR